MRISTPQAFNNGVAGLQRNYANVMRTQEQISTGNRILTPADDPVASVRLLQLEQQQNVLSQYNANLTAAKNSLTQEEVTLNSVNTVLQRVRELAVQAGNGGLSAEDRKSIAAELRECEDELLSLMNTRNARGEYLFSGFQGKTQPFVRAADGSYSYQGDEGQRNLQIASSLNIAISDSGKSIFESVTNAGRLEVADRDNLGFPVSEPLVSDEVAFSSYQGIRIAFDPVVEGKYEVFGMPKDGGAEVSLGTSNLDNDNDSDDKLVYGGVTLFVGGQPPTGSVILVQGKVPVAEKQGILDTVANLRVALEDPTANGNDIRDAVAVALTNLDHGMISVDAARGNIGARLNVIETTQTDNEDVALVNKAVQAELRELDYAEALSRLSFQTIILEAAQQSYVKISGLNLFNAMR
ncbi:flagellar hook-associated protein FlgL [Pseudomonas stutzeri]|uniref:flagellar hook-associated protein FlgL n=1 Tax=Stutzerimonas stutzeri TaxID=316 RepID=UPI001F1B9F01|nr:flagellar hook-associated protein FlgL [Stutzerimonas stutzeri]MCF0016182.1 flagellar hook-associated protein FlgL [Stutzerimonas stutzeri]MCF0018100.1 flagellar hook-associated protein FlgL [Stutzerimonas stutzeri]MDH0101935.1 flagellar hook-associated protein FlgL [Stutzerimonas stutzeri]MDH1589364.1 flagellar hook-associated protein FlgL [Stutzerimonas stutzeri]